MQPTPGRKDFAALAIIVAVIVYGELYPFAFRTPLHGMGPLTVLLRTWNVPSSRSDALANVVLYLPFGFFAVRTLHPGWGAPLRLMLVTLVGAALSVACEMTQYFEPRVEGASDVYANIVGTFIGAGFGVRFTQEFRLPGLRELRLRPFPTLLLVSWLCYRLYPFVPTIDLHKYLDVLKFLVNSQVTPYDFFRYTVMWLTVAALTESIAREQRSRSLYPLLAGCVLFAKILIVSSVITINEVAGIGAGYLIWLMVLGFNPRSRAWMMSIALFLYVVLWRLEPFQFGPPKRSFGWVPFLSFLYGSTDVNVESFLEKVFYYGSLIWLMNEAGASLRIAAIVVAVLVFVTSGVEIYLPDRSAEITDGLIVLMMASLIALGNERSVHKIVVPNRRYRHRRRKIS